MTARVLVTGATGFVGSQVCRDLAAAGYIVRAALRTDRIVPTSIAERAIVGDIGSGTHWGAALEDVDFVIHAAARVHLMHDSPANADLYLETNARGTLRLATQAAEAGVKRLVFLSTIKVNGEEGKNTAYTAADTPAPQDAYGVSKQRAEEHLREVASSSSLEAVVIRPVLVYGPGVRANFLRLLSWVERERALPLGAIRNRRSMVSVWNLSNLVATVLTHPAAANRTWMVSDGADLSTPALIRTLAEAMGRRDRLIFVPVGLLRVLGVCTGKSAEISRLCGSLYVDVSNTRQALSWNPPLTVQEGLARTVDWYLSRNDVHGR